MIQNEPIDLLEDVNDDNLVRASQGKRFANYIVDVIVFYIVIILIGFLIALVNPSLLGDMDTDSPMGNLGDRLLALFLYAIYMGIVEAAFKGKSLGKLITGTRAVNLDGSRISVQTAFTRGFTRAVPFCVFSAFGTPCNPWQDKWTDTMVIDEKLSGR